MIGYIAFNDSKYIYSNKPLTKNSIPVDLSGLYRQNANLLTGYTYASDYDDLLLYYGDGWNYFKTEADYLLWRLKYGL